MGILAPYRPLGEACVDRPWLNVLLFSSSILSSLEYVLKHDIKDEVDLEGHPKRLGTTQDFSDPKDATIWCIRKWEEAGAIVIGKLNMHEFGLGTRIHF